LERWEGEGKGGKIFNLEGGRGGEQFLLHCQKYF